MICEHGYPEGGICPECENAEISASLMGVAMSRNNVEQHRHLDAKQFLDEVIGEAMAAYVKFPSSDMVLAALMEEVGELAQAVMERERSVDALRVFTPGIESVRRNDAIALVQEKWSRDNIRREAVQVAAMAMRIAVEGDPRFPSSQVGD